MIKTLKTSVTNEFIAILILSKVFSIVTFNIYKNESVDFYSSILNLSVNSSLILFFSLIFMYLNNKIKLDIFSIITTNNKTFSLFNLLCLFLVSFIYFVYTLNTFLDFTTDAIYKKNDFLPICILLFLIIGYTLYNGISSISKTSIVVISLFYIFIAFLFLSLIIEFDFDNLMFNENIKLNLKYNIQSLVYNFEFILMFYFLKFCKKEKKIYFNYIIKSFVLIFILSLIAELTVGDFLKQFEYPFFSLSKITDASFFRRLDGFFIIIWIFISFVKISAISFLLYDTINKILSYFEFSINVVLFTFLNFIIYIVFKFFKIDNINIGFIYMTLFIYLMVLIFTSIILKNRKRENK